jgi:hypothetical protein
MGKPYSIDLRFLLSVHSVNNDGIITRREEFCTMYEEDTSFLKIQYFTD